MNNKYDLINRCYINGDGIPIVLLHGMGGPIVWGKMEQILSKKFKIIIPTFPGYLEEDGIIEYTDDFYVEFLEELRNRLGLKQLNIVGVSMGGRTATNYCIKYPHNISTLTLIDSIGIGNMSPLVAMPIVNKIFPYLLKRLLANPKNMIKLGINDFINTDSEIFEENMEFFIDMMKNENVRTNFINILVKVGVKSKEWEQCLRKLNVPTMILWAKEDKTAPVKWGYRLNEIIMNSQLHILDEYRHMAIMEEPKFFTDKIYDFIRENINQLEFS